MTPAHPPAAGPLSGIRVVDLTQVVSGPAAMGTLASQGAEVIKVEALSGDVTRRSRQKSPGFAPSYIACNSGKQAIALDLKNPATADILWRLIERADVFAQNFRPGAIERLGFSAEAVMARNPKLVYLSINGVGETGPYASKRVYDPIIQALSGMAHIQADPTSGRPKMVRTL
ncbi:MAG: CoA transferase, partial [Pseudomonadota bacterium]|nr:CoA transferase [Pseudomonadota bacterium]